MIRAIARQAEAERERRAKVIHAEQQRLSRSGLQQQELRTGKMALGPERGDERELKETDEQKITKATQTPGFARERTGETVGARRKNAGTNQGSKGGEPPCWRPAQRPPRTLLHAINPN
jgi:hypothetical protein